MTKTPSMVVFTDLDGTLLDHHTYSFEAALPALKRLKEEGVPWLFNTSKTFAELQQLRIDLDNPWPMIVENGSGVAIPDNPLCNKLFPKLLTDRVPDRIGSFDFYSLGLMRSEFLPRLEPLKSKYKFFGYDDMSPEKLVELTGLSQAQARQSMDRHYTEPCVWLDTEEAFRQFQKELESLDLICVRGGRFAHIMGKTDKGAALKWVTNAFFTQADCRSVALGDGENDLLMLNSAEIAILVRSPVHKPPGPCTAKRSMLTDELGPKGWAGAIIALLEEQVDKKVRTEQSIN